MLRKLAVGIALCVLGAGAANAGPQFVDKSGVADFGYDVVAYHTNFQAVKGSPEFSAPYNGATFWFGSAAHRDLFVKSPAAYAPAFDGHCAFAVASHKKLTVDPEAFSIVDPSTGRLVDRSTYQPGTGVLYLNYDPGVNRKFNAAPAETIAKANHAWKGCLEKQPAANPSKGLSDLLPGSRPKSCPK